jgi:FkbM family methyltransferase
MKSISNFIKRTKKNTRIFTVRLAISYSLSRRLLNVVYLKLTPVQRSLFHREFAKIFRNTYVHGNSGTWEVVFHGKSILMPLTSERFWLDWDSAVSITGHDINVKETYNALINSSEAPDFFIDIGGNYGTHSLLFLVHHIKTMTFEPNTSCHDYFREICKLNRVTPKLEPVALGERDGYVELSYPERDTWLGSIDAEVIKSLASTQELVKKKVGMKKLDDYLPQIENKQTLIKIDTEGNELAVLRGAVNTLQNILPKIIFECWGDDNRFGLFDFFAQHKYKIFNVPWDPVNKSQPLDFDQFIASSSTNFIAMPTLNEDL